jgi:hypothetical protein
MSDAERAPTARDFLVVEMARAAHTHCDRCERALGASHLERRILVGVTDPTEVYVFCGQACVDAWCAP